MTTQTLTTYRIHYRHPNVDGLHGYEGPTCTNCFIPMGDYGNIYQCPKCPNWRYK